MEGYKEDPWGGIVMSKPGGERMWRLSYTSELLALDLKTQSHHSTGEKIISFNGSGKKSTCLFQGPQLCAAIFNLYSPFAWRVPDIPRISGKCLTTPFHVASGSRVLGSYSINVLTSMSCMSLGHFSRRWLIMVSYEGDLQEQKEDWDIRVW